jgi:hypothetical protein
VYTAGIRAMSRSGFGAFIRSLAQAANKARHRMSGDNASLKLECRQMPLIGALGC